MNGVERPERRVPDELLAAGQNRGGDLHQIPSLTVGAHARLDEGKVAGRQVARLPTAAQCRHHLQRKDGR